MISFKARGPGGRTLIAVGLSDENVRRLQQGMPALLKLDRFGLDNHELVIFTGETEESMKADLIKVGMLQRPS